MKVCWNITNKCNANCKHCFRNTQEQPLSLEQNMKILENLSGIVHTISFSGGEVLLYDDVFELIQAAKKKGIVCAIITNAILINQSNIDKIIRSIDKITFSIDSIDDNQNAKIGRGEGYCKHLNDIINYINKKIDKFLTSKLTGFPIMLLFFALIFWITITGANYPSQMLSNFFNFLEGKLV